MEYEPTLVPAIIFSDSVIREHGTNKLTLIGCFLKFNADRIPFAAPPFFATAVLTNFRGKLEKVNVCLRIEQAGSGHVVASVAAAFGSAKEVELTDAIEIPFPVAPSVFPAAGVYKAVILVNNEKVNSRDLIVQSVTSSAIDKI